MKSISITSLRTSIIILPFLMCVMLVSCSGNNAAPEGKANDAAAHMTGSMELNYATQFHVDYYEDDITLVRIEDGLEYVLTSDPAGLPDWADGEMIEGRTVITVPAEKVYMAASSGMDLIDALGGLGSVVMTSTQASDWALPGIRELVESDEIHYVGKYRAPDYEALLEGDVDLAIESTMIYHNPDVKDQLESLGIPVLVERSSYETDPLGRLEWIRLYGLLLGREDAAETYFEEAVAKVTDIDTASIDGMPRVAFFSVSSNGAVVVRKPGDYVTKMIEMAGGSYALDGITDEDDNALSTMNMQMEAFYDKASESDILIYNSAIESELTRISDLTDMAPQLEDFRAVRNGNVWCTNKNVFQKSTGAADMIAELNQIFAGTADDSNLEYFHKLR